MLRAVSANLGRRVAGARWARQVFGLTGDGAVDLAFLQEVPLGEDWVDLCEKAGLGIATDLDSNYRVRSFLLWRRSSVTAEPSGCPPPTITARTSLLSGWSCRSWARRLQCPFMQVRRL